MVSKLPEFEVKLERIRRLSASTLDFRFVREDNKAVEFEPGQFFRFTFTDRVGAFERSYSLCNQGEDVAGSPYLDLVISQVEGGRASEYLFNCDVGVNARVTGPYGRLVLPSHLPNRLFMVATSVGIAPFMPMLNALTSPLAREDLEVYFLFGVRDPSEFIYGDALVSLADSYPGFHLLTCYSRNMPASPSARDHSGYVQQTLQGITLDSTTDFFLLCGNPKMIDDVYSLLKDQGFTGKQVVREKYVFARETGATKINAMSDEQKKLLAEKMKKYQS